MSGRQGTPRLPALAALALSVVSAVALGACGSATGGTAFSGARGTGTLGSDLPAAPAAPAAVAYSGSAGAWLALPMGRLGDPSNTFWQVLFMLSPAAGAGGSGGGAAAGSWSLVTPPGVADNGGLAMSAASGGAGTPVVIGVDASRYLTFSPLAATLDGGRSWSPGLLPGALVPEAGALSVTAGMDVALLAAGTAATAGGGEQVVTAPVAGAASWTRLTDEALIAMSPAARRCGVTSLTAVAVASGGGVYVGADCSHRGAAGLFEVSGTGAVRAVAPTLGGPLTSANVQVAALVPTPYGASVLLAVTKGRTTAYVGAWSGRAGTWSLSMPLEAAAGSPLRSIGSDRRGGWLVLLGPGGGSEGRVASVSPGAGARWASYPAPPSSAQDAVLVGGVPEVASVSLSTLTLYVPTGGVPGGPPWRENQVIEVPIEYGSSG